MEGFQILARIANPPEGLLAKYTRKERDFFFEYANFVLRSIESPEITGKLSSLIKIEGLRVNKTIDLRVMVFPARPLTGRPRNILHGSYNQDSAQISLYPLKLPREWLRKEGFSLFRTRRADLSMSQQQTLRRIFASAVSTLIHEVLHVKLEARSLPRYAEESLVRKLERKYAEEWLGDLDPGQLPYHSDDSMNPPSHR